MKLPLILVVTRAIIRNQRMRRMWMFYIVLAALVMLFLGSTVLDRALASNLAAFCIFWLGCAWLTLAAFLLAIFDLMIVNAQARRKQRELRQTMLNVDDDDADQN